MQNSGLRLVIKLQTRVGNFKFGTRAGKHKSGTRAGKYKLRPGLVNTNWGQVREPGLGARARAGDKQSKQHIRKS